MRRLDSPTVTCAVTPAACALLMLGALAGCNESPTRLGRFTHGPRNEKARIGASPVDAGRDGSHAGASLEIPGSTEPSHEDAASPPSEDVAIGSPEDPPHEEAPPHEDPPHEDPPPPEPVDDPAPNFTPPDGEPPWLIQSGDSVFFVGNSFFGGADDRLADLVSALGATVEPAITIHTGQHVVYGNQPLSWFFQQPESQGAIQSGQYDVFVLQGEEREPVDRTEAFKQAVRDYQQAVIATGGRIVLFMTWNVEWAGDTGFFRELSTVYDDLGRELGVPVIPVGLIYDDCGESPYGDQPAYWLLESDLLHQNDMGTAVNTYATFAMLTGINPQGQRSVGRFGTFAPGLLDYLSDMSWARVAPRLGR